MLDGTRRAKAKLAQIALVKLRKLAFANLRPLSTRYGGGEVSLALLGPLRIQAVDFFPSAVQRPGERDQVDVDGGSAARTT